jgi:hypothetical protein
MADGGANISRGINRGSAQVYDTSGPVNMYARLMQQQQLKRAAETKALTDKLDKFDSKGVRVQDREGFNKVYEDWQKASIEALKATDRNEKFRLNAEAQNKLNTAEQFVYDSKAKTQRDLAVGTKILGKPYFFSEEGKKTFEKSLVAPIYSKDDIADYSTIPLGHDKSKVAKDIAAVNESLYKIAKYDVSQGVEKKVGDLTYAEFSKIKRVSPEEQIKGYELLYRVNDGFQALLEEDYSDLDWDNNKEQALQTALTDFSAKYPLVKDEGVERRTIPNNDMTEYQRRRLALAQAEGGGGGKDAETYRQQIIGGIINNDKGSIDEMKAYLPSGSKVDYRTSNPTKTSKGDYNLIRVDIPAVLDVDGTIKKPGIVEDISLSLGDAKNRLNAILSEYTGEKISPSKLNIKGGKPRGEQIEIKGQEKTTKPTKELTGKTVRIQLPTGEIGDIPKDKAAAFLKKYPKAKIIK